MITVTDIQRLMSLTNSQLESLIDEDDYDLDEMDEAEAPEKEPTVDAHDPYPPMRARPRPGHFGTGCTECQPCASRRSSPSA